MKELVAIIKHPIADKLKELLSAVREHERATTLSSLSPAEAPLTIDYVCKTCGRYKKEHVYNPRLPFACIQYTPIVEPAPAPAPAPLKELVEQHCRCACCIDAKSRGRSGREIIDACNCGDYAEAERCDCVFCLAMMSALSSQPPTSEEILDRKPPICNVCDKPFLHELVCEDCLEHRGYVLKGSPQPPSKP